MICSNKLIWVMIGIVELHVVIVNCLGLVLYLGRAPRTKETLPDFREWSRVTRRPRIFRGLTGCQRTPQFSSVTKYAYIIKLTLTPHVIQI